MKENDKLLEAQRIDQRTRYDVEMHARDRLLPGIENYSRHIDGRQPGERPIRSWTISRTISSSFVDESHVTLPQVRAMYNGDRARKESWSTTASVCPSALDNRPLRFDEFEQKVNQAIYVSATPGEYELAACTGQIVEQIIRPTGLLDPEVVVRPTRDRSTIWSARSTRTSGTSARWSRR